LRAAALALALAALGLAGEWWHMRRIEQQLLPVVTSESASVKDLGIVWQEETFARSDVLPLYGSSELIKRAPNKASQFFASYPTGFAVSPVGRPSCTTLILLEKLAASAGQARGHKVVLCMSPSWFVTKGANHDGFGGNFSMMQASELFFSAPLSLPLKRSIAGRMLRYPEVFKKNPLLAAAVPSLASDRPRDRWIYFACLPLGRLQNMVYRLQDHFEVLDHLKDDRQIRRPVKRQESATDWEALLAASQRNWVPLPADIDEPDRTRVFTGDGMFLQSLQHSYEWGDMDLLLRATRELGLDPLLLSLPLEYGHYERMGVSRSSIDAYLWRLNESARHYQIPVVDFAELVEDPRLFADHNGHPNGTGWLYIDRALDDFYHGRPPGHRLTLPRDQEMLPSETSSR